MKQKTFSSLIDALSDEPKPIGVRLESLGLDKASFEKSFSKELLLTPVYGSSFLKFLQDNKDVLGSDEGIAAQPLPADYKNPFEDVSSPVRIRLSELGLNGRQLSSMFAKDVLDLEVTGTEFQDFIVNNQDKFLNQMGKLAEKEVSND